ncbi:MAG: MFS transporter [Dehalococcoidia bacterium]|nr:MFS transporter [Dehalococcoidia bacterium]
MIARRVVCDAMIRGDPSGGPMNLRSIALPRVASGIFYGWWIVGAGVVIHGMISALFMQSYGAYVVLLREEFGWSATLLSVGFSLVQLENGVLGPIQGWLTDRFGPRAIMRVGLLIWALGFASLSQVNSPVMFFVSVVLIAIGTGLGGFLSLAVSVVHWFERRRAIALGLLATGFALGGLLVPVVAASLESIGWRGTALLSAGLVLVVALPLSQLVRHRPEPYGYRPDGGRLTDDDREGDAASGAAAALPAASGGTSFTAREALRTPAFWYLSLGHGASLLVVSALMVHLIPHLRDSLGYSLQQAASVVSLLAFAQAVGTIAGGFGGDRFNKRTIVVFCMLGHVVALLLLAYASALWMVIAFALINGLAWGARGPLMQAMRADYFGPRSFGTIMGFSSLIMMVGMMTGPILAAVMVERTGNYEAGFTVLAGLALIGTFFFALARKPNAPVATGGTPAAVSAD